MGENGPDSWFSLGESGGICEHVHELSGSIKYGEFLNHLIID
jgi:hypothetical protein